MCGIHLIINKTQDLDPAVINMMAAQTRYRGPDQTITKNINTSTHSYHLAANRLMITDTSENASQPFFSHDGRYALLFNGEIYNYHTLKNELLGDGIRFSSHSDTEALFQWLTKYGKSRVSELGGMFAFIFIDFATDKIFIARDRFGIKPIYYYQNEKYFIVSSEIQSIVKTGLIPKRLNEEQVRHYLLYKYAKSPDTFFDGIAEVSPGAILQIKDGKTTSETFAHHQCQKENTSVRLQDIENLLTDSLLHQINSPVPVGLLLSGGVDSTLLLALARKEGFTLPTFSIVNSATEKHFGTNDYKFARKAALLFESDHHEFEIDISILNGFFNFIQMLDQPIGDSSYLMTLEICRNASKSMKVLLSGAGADELFGGYNRHRGFHQYLNNRNSLNLLFPLLKPALKMLPTGFPHPLRKSFRLLKKLGSSYDSSPENTFNNFVTFNEFSDPGASPTLLNFNNKRDWLAWALDHDLKNYLTGDILALSDKASMRYGIELRVPYLDNNLVSHMKSISPELVMLRGQKWILKELLKKYGGKNFADRPKEGFGLPLSHWLTDKKLRHLWEFAVDPEHIIFRFVDKSLLDKILRQQQKHVEDHGPLLWSVLVLAHWLHHNFE
jgi:asparagine synthase (glutamine-hydrolysing)